MADKSKSRPDAETRLEKSQKRLEEGQKAMKEQIAADQAVRERTAKLRALRLAKEAADEVERASRPVVKAKAVKKKVKTP